MTTATVTSKGQITIAAEGRQALQVDAGDRIEFLHSGLTRTQLVQALEAWVRAKQLVVAQAEHVVRALRVFATGSADFADCLIDRTAVRAGCARTMTFDVAAANAAGITLPV